MAKIRAATVKGSVFYTDEFARYNDVSARFVDVNTRFADVNATIAGFREDVNHRFDGLDRRFSDLDGKFDRHFVWLIGMMVTGFITVIGALVSIVNR